KHPNSLRECGKAGIVRRLEVLRVQGEYIEIPSRVGKVGGKLLPTQSTDGRVRREQITHQEQSARADARSYRRIPNSFPTPDGRGHGRPGLRACLKLCRILVRNDPSSAR